ncbi:MAG: phosphatase PAP2 family protein [Gaiellales bacterium]
MPKREHTAISLAREAALVAGAMLTYFAIRNVTAGDAATAHVNADRLVDAERTLGIDWERALQGPVTGHEWLVDLANWIYIWGHWPVILSTAAILFVVRRDVYRRLRTAMFVSGGVGFLFFGLLPLAPPRLVGLGLIDTVTERSDAYRALQPPGLTNQFAAFPSLHAGWNLLLGICLFWSTRHLLVRIFAVLSPIAMALAVVVTANHFVLDVWAGWLVALFGLAVALWLEVWREMPMKSLSGRTLDIHAPRRACGAAADDSGAVPGRPPRGQPSRGASRARRAVNPARGGPPAAARTDRGQAPQAAWPAPCALGQMVSRPGLGQPADAERAASRGPEQPRADARSQRTQPSPCQPRSRDRRA